MIRQWVNGVECTSIDTRDRGLAYGDGLFETMVYREGDIEYWSKHYARLQYGCRQLKIPCLDEARLYDELCSCIEPEDDVGIVKLMITRGSGERGYRISGNEQVVRVLIRSDFPDYPGAYYTGGVDVCVCDTRLADQPQLAGIKHLNRLQQVLARSEWDNEFAEGLMLDHQGHVIEGTMTNIFCSYDGVSLETPGTERCGVAGVQRQIVMDWAAAMGVPVQVSDITLDRLLSAREIFLTNRVIGIWPVKSINDIQFPVHELTQTLQKKAGLLSEESL